ncbi:unnamed protein product [Caretta caretta]
MAFERNDFLLTVQNLLSCIALRYYYSICNSGPLHVRLLLQWDQHEACSRRGLVSPSKLLRLSHLMRGDFAGFQN